MNRMRIIFAVLSVMVAACIGCTNPDPTQGFTMSSQYRRDVRTIAVPIFRRGTDEYRRDIEFRLTRAVVKHIEADTHYKVVKKPRADTLLSGTIRKVEEDVLSFNPHTGRAMEIQMRLIVDFTWKDLRTGEVLLDKKNFHVASDYIPARPLSEDFFLGSEDAFNKMARRIVEQLRQKW